MRKPNRVMWAGTATAVALLAASALGSVASAKSVRRAAPQYGGTLVWALPEQADINWYLPLANGANDSLYNFQLLNQMYLPLVYVANDYHFDYANSIATKVVYNKEGTVYQVFMNPKWHWSDGTPVTSKDVLFTWQLIQATSNPKAAAPWPWVGAGSGDVPQGIQSVVANGPYEFTITLKQPANQGWFMYNGLSDFMPLPMQAWDKYPNNMTQEIKWLGTQATSPTIDSVIDGPFKLSSAVNNQSWTLVPNPNYSGPKPYLSKVVFAYQTSDSSEFAALKTDSVQLGYLPLGDYGARAELPDHLLTTYDFGYGGIWPNMNAQAPGGAGSLLSQLYIRQAMEMDINQNAISKIIWHGAAEPLYGAIPPNPKTIFLSPELAKPIYPYNPAAAKALLEKHGWHEVDGVMTRGSQKLQFSMLARSGDIAVTEEGEYIQQEWGQIGIKVTLKPEPFSTQIGIISKPNDWQLSYGVNIIYGGSYPSGFELFGKGGGLNDMGYVNAKEEALINATHQPWPNDQVNLQHYFAYANYTAEQLPNIWVPLHGTIIAWAPNVHITVANYNPTTGDPLIQYWWMSK